MRISFWLPKSKRWIAKAIIKVRSEASKQGIPLSNANVILMILEEALKEYEEVNIEEPRKKFAGKKKRSIIFRNEDSWFLNCIDKIVEAKQLSGIPTSFSAELIRCAKNGFQNTCHGEKLDRKILNENSN